MSSHELWYHLDLQCKPLDSLADIYSFVLDPPPWRSLCEPATPHSKYLVRNSDVNGNLDDVALERPQNFCHFDLDGEQPERHHEGRLPRTLVCHDMANGYHDDSAIDGTGNHDAYTFYNWAAVDIFCYFSHHLVTIPPLGWINVAHAHGVKVIGTIITEWSEGAQFWGAVLASEQEMHELVSALVSIARTLKFDGWLLNVENKVSSPERLVEFVRRLHRTLHDELPDAELIWYDSVISDGSLSWQNQLNHKNKQFFDVCDGFFLNYSWSEDDIRASLQEAGARARDVFVGIDVWGRNFYGGGQFNTQQAVKLAHKYGCSLAIFAPAWTFEALGPDGDPRDPHAVLSAESTTRLQRLLLRDRALWDSLWPYLNTRVPCQLPFKTSFCRGNGKKRHMYGEVLCNTPWYNLRHQQYQPNSSHGAHGYLLSTDARIRRASRLALRNGRGILKVRESLLGFRPLDLDDPDSELSHHPPIHIQPSKRKMDQSSRESSRDSVNLFTNQSAVNQADQTVSLSVKPLDQSINQSAKESTDQPTNQLNDHSVDQPANQLEEKSADQIVNQITDQIVQSVEQSTAKSSSQPINQLAEQIVDQSAVKSTDQPTNQITDQAVDQPIEKTRDRPVSPLIDQAVDQSAARTVNRPGNQSADQCSTLSVTQPTESDESQPLLLENIAGRSISSDEALARPRKFKNVFKNILKIKKSKVDFKQEASRESREDLEAVEEPEDLQGEPEHSRVQIAPDLRIDLSQYVKKTRLTLAYVYDERDCLETYFEDSFNGGSCLKINPSDYVDETHRTIRLFHCDFNIRDSLVVCMVTKPAVGFARQSLNLWLMAKETRGASQRVVLLGRYDEQDSSPRIPGLITQAPLRPGSPEFKAMQTHLLLNEPGFYMPTENLYGWKVFYYVVRVPGCRVSCVAARTAHPAGAVLLGHVALCEWRVTSQHSGGGMQHAGTRNKCGPETC